MSRLSKYCKYKPEDLNKIQNSLEKLYGINESLCKNERKPTEFERLYIEPYKGMPVIKEVVEAL